MHKNNKSRRILAGLALFFALLLQVSSAHPFVQTIILPLDSARGKLGVQKLVFKIDNPENADSYITKYLKDVYPLISDETMNNIISEKIINKFLTNDTLGIVDFYT